MKRTYEPPTIEATVNPQTAIDLWWERRQHAMVADTANNHELVRCTECDDLFCQAPECRGHQLTEGVCEFCQFSL